MFRDTSMDYLSRDEVLEIWNNNMRLTDEQLLAMDETEFPGKSERTFPSLPWRSRYMPPHIATRN